MLSSRLLQTACSLIFIAAFGAAEVCAAYLQAHPASPTAWFLTIEIFRPFELARSGTSPLRWFFGPWALLGALVAGAAVVMLHRLRLRFGIALASNLTFLGAIALAWSSAGLSVGHEAALQSTVRLSAWDGGLVGALLASSFAAALVSHAQFAVPGNHHEAGR